MTEKEAWAKIAEMWREPNGDGSAYCGKCRVRGLCGAIYLMELKLETMMRMWARIYEVTKTSGSYWGFKWPVTLDGAKARVAFCEEQIRRIEAEEAK